MTDLANQILDASEHGCVAVDRDRRVTYWNRRMEELARVTRDRIAGQRLFDTLPGWRGTEADLAGAFTGKIVHARTFPLGPGTFEATYTPLGHPVVTGVAVELRDVTELRESNARFQIMADTSPVLLWMAGSDALCSFFNQRWLDFTGRPLEAELGNGWAEGVHPEDFQRCMDTYMTAFVERRAFRMEYRLRRHDGEYRWLLDTGVPRQLPSGEHGYIGSCIDVTELKLARDELDRRVRDRTAELEAFTYSVSHDLRSPLRGIDGFARALLESYLDVLDERGQHYLDRIRGAAQHMGHLIDGLLQLSRIGRKDLQIAACDVSQLAREVARSLRDQEPERTVDIAIEDAMIVQADPQLLRIALDNLLGNAWKFTGKTAAPRIAVRSQRRDGNFVLVVSDNGVGFDMAYSAKLFGAFQRLHRQSEFPGTGIGLATVAKIASRHRARIAAESVVDQGATFSITFPA